MRRLIAFLTFVIAAVGFVPCACANPRDLPKAAREAWLRVDTPNFTLFSMLGADETIRLGTNLEYLRESLTRSSSGLDLQTAVGTFVYVFKGEGAFAPYKVNSDGAEANVAGYCIPSSEGTYLALNATAQVAALRVVYHEYIHSMLHSSFSRIPLWLNEGLAEFFSTFQASVDTAEFGHPIGSHLRWLRSHKMMPVAELSAVTVESPDYNEGKRQRTFYAQAWLLTHYLLIGDLEVDRAGKLLDLLGQGMPELEALAMASGAPISSLDASLKEYSRESSLNFVIRHLPDTLRAGGACSRMMERRESLYRLGDLLAHRPSTQWVSAEAHLRASLEKDSTDADPVCMLGFLAERRGDAATARSFYEKAVARDSSNARAQSLLGRSFLREFYDSSDLRLRSYATTPPLLVRARESFRKCMELNPKSVEDCIGFGRTFLYDRGSPWEGIAALKATWEAHPMRTDALTDLTILTAYANGGGAARMLIDMYLRRLGTPHQVGNAEGAALDADYRTAVSLAEGGRADSACALLRDASEGTKDPELAHRAHEMLRSVQAHAKKDTDITLYNHAIDLANAGEYDSAAVTFEAVARAAQDMMLRQQASEAAQRARLTGRYREALRLTTNERYQEATVILQRLLASDPPDEIAENAREALAEVERLARGRR